MKKLMIYSILSLMFALFQTLIRSICGLLVSCCEAVR
jgi:hypothetical protein